MTSELTYIYERLSNQARFIQYFITGKLKISGREHADIVHDLRKLQFKPFPKKAKAVVAADPDASIIDPADLEETDDATAAGSLSDYDYLLEMSISSLTAAKAKKLLAQRDEREKELHLLLELTPKQMWLSDLDAFDAAWEKVLEGDEAAYTSSTAAAAAKKGKGKVGGMKGNTLESAFAKAAALKAQQITDINSPPAKKAPAAKKAAGEKAETKPKVTLPKAKAAPAPKAGPSVKAAPPKKKIVYDSDMSESEADITLHDDDSMEHSAVSDNAPQMDDEEDEDDFVIKAPAKRKAAPVADEEDEEEEAPKAKKAPAPRKAAPSKVIELSDDDEDEDSGSDAEMDEDEDEQSFVAKPKKSRR